MAAALVKRRLQRATVAAVSAAVIALACGSCAHDSRSSMADYCAIMPDSVGLYVGNPVTQMGYPIGKVTAITPTTNDVRIDFSITPQRRLPNDVKAVTRSASILADRALELVGNYESGPALPAGGCIPLAQSSTPKSLSEVIGAATTFVNSINPDGSTNVGDTVNALDRALHNNGPGLNELLTTSSAILDSPDAAIGDIGSIITNLADLTKTLVAIRGPLKQAMLDAQQTTADAATTVKGGSIIFGNLLPIFTLVSDLQVELGDETQQTLDVTQFALRKAAAHATFFASLLKPMPFLINGIENIVNQHQFNIRYRPPLYRIRTPDGLLTCGTMNAEVPGSCADVAGTPYAVDTALLQYVLTEANKR